MKNLTFLFVAGLFLMSCQNPGDDLTGRDPDPTPTTDLAAARGLLVSQVANKMILPAFYQLRGSLEALETAIGDFIQSPGPDQLTNARSALKDSWMIWQDAAIFQFGPSVTYTLQNVLNTYPTDEDRIESNIASGGYIVGSIGNQDAIGFPALDYLLNGLAENDAQILEYYQGDAGADARKQYLRDLTRFMHSQVEITYTEWSSEGENYLAKFTGAEALGTDVGSSLGQIVNAMDKGFQRFVRDGKVAIPAGIRSAGVPRPRAVEARYAGYSVELLVASLKAYERLFLGIGADDKPATGLYDYLIALNAEDLANDIKAQYVRVIELAGSLQDPLSEEITRDPEKVNTVFMEMQKIVVLTKSDMASIMGITITNQDNDGD